VTRRISRRSTLKATGIGMGAGFGATALATPAGTPVSPSFTRGRCTPVPGRGPSGRVGGAEAVRPRLAVMSLVVHGSWSKGVIQL
jgi:hypothetical protein